VKESFQSRLTHAQDANSLRPRLLEIFDRISCRSRACVWGILVIIHDKYGTSGERGTKVQWKIAEERSGKRKRKISSGPLNLGIGLSICCASFRVRGLVDRAAPTVDTTIDLITVTLLSRKDGRDMFPQHLVPLAHPPRFPPTQLRPSHTVLEIPLPLLPFLSNNDVLVSFSIPVPPFPSSRRSSARK